MLGLPFGFPDDLERLGPRPVQRLAPVRLKLAQLAVVLLPQGVHLARRRRDPLQVRLRRLLVGRQLLDHCRDGVFLV